MPTATNHDRCIVTLPGELFQGQAIDGKTVRGASAHGDKTHLVSLVQHSSGVTLAQTEVPAKRNEISAAPTLLRDRDLCGTVTTGEALLPDRHREPGAGAAPEAQQVEAPRSLEESAIASIAQVLRERPELIVGVMQFLEQQAFESDQPGTR